MPLSNDEIEAIQEFERLGAAESQKCMMEQSEFVKLQQDIIDQELMEMPAKEVGEILSDMKAWEAFNFLERIGRLRAWLVYMSLEKP